MNAKFFSKGKGFLRWYRYSIRNVSSFIKNSLDYFSSLSDKKTISNQSVQKLGKTWFFYIIDLIEPFLYIESTKAKEERK